MSSLTAFLGLTKAADTEQYDVDIVNANLDLIDTAIQSLDGRVDPWETVVEVIGDGATAGAPVNGITGAANWTATTIKLRRLGKMREVFFTMTRATAALTFDASGLVADSVMFILPVGDRPGVTVGLNQLEGTAVPKWVGGCNAAGQVYIQKGDASGSIAVGNTIVGSISYIQAN